MDIIVEELLKVHDQLNPKIWNSDNKLIPEIRKKIIEIAVQFMKSIEIPIEIMDIHVLGSNASYTYTEFSDLDVHIIVNYDMIDASKEITQIFFNTKKSSFNKTYDIKIKGISVELYVEDVNTTTISNGIYSIFCDDWIKFPDKVDIPDISLEPELSTVKDHIYNALNSNDLIEIEKQINLLYLIRKNSITVEGEFSKGNLIFKEIRNIGLLDQLKCKRIELKSKELSMEKYNKYKNIDVL